MTTPEELRRRADELEQMRRAGIERAAFVPDEGGTLLGIIPSGSNHEMRVTWCTPRDRAPQMRVRLWVDEGFGYVPKRGVGFDVPFYRMVEFSRAVAEGLDYAIQHQKVAAARPHRNGDARRR